MNREWVIAGAITVGLHALLLFGFRVEMAAVPLPAAETEVDVDLIAAVPAPAPASAVPEAPAPTQPPEPVPPPVAPPPPPEPAATPSPPVESTPLPVEPKPTPRETPAHREVAKSAHPNPAAAKSAAPGPTAKSAAAAAGAPGGVTSPVRPRSNPRPAYPPEARRLGQQGRVILEVQVGADGRAISVSVKRSSGFPALDSAAVQAVQRWTFEPARMAGIPIASRADVPVNFSLAQ